MRTLVRLCAIMVLAYFLPNTIAAQQLPLKGIVKNSETNEGIPAVSIQITGTLRGTYSRANGEFELVVPQYPVSVTFSSIGYESVVINVADDTYQTFVMVPKPDFGQEVVVAATRSSERLIESPITVERVNSRTIANSPAASYYDIVQNLKGVDVVTSSLTFKTPTTRGFMASGNTRFNQIVDGMDNQAPGLNFSVGSVIGLTQLDVESMELLPGASSVLYGPGGMNGTLVINSKNPFKYQGLSLEVKEGLMHIDGKQRPPGGFHNYALRWGQKLSDRFAFKIASEYIWAKDWAGVDYRNYNRIGLEGAPKAGTRETDPNYDGINVYGDETKADIRQVLNGVAAQAPFLAPYISTLTANPINVSRTGYNELDIIDPRTINFKLSGALHYKITQNTEAILSGNWGTGNTVYTGSDRYSFKNLKVGQYKFELQNKDWFLRGYTTQEDAGESFNATVTTQYTNEAWKESPGSNGWFAQYGQAYLNAKLAGKSDSEAHNAARATADIGRPEAGSQQFRRIYDSVRMISISDGGGRFIEKSALYMGEGQYNFSSLLNNYVDLLVGANYKLYSLSSQGTLFVDSAGAIKINEVGAYVQASKWIGDVLRITLAGRYDKNQNFDGRFTPRATMLFKVAENNNIRVSYQTAYRFPSTQMQWIDLNVGGNTRLIGGDQSFITFYEFDTKPVYYVSDLQNGQTVPWDKKKYKPESVQSFEAGYKGLMVENRLMIDLYGYFGQYRDFLSRTTVIRRSDGGTPTQADLASGNVSIFSVPVNIQEKVKTYGFGFGLDYRLPQNFLLAANISSDNLTELPQGFVSFFNSPKWRFNGTFANTGFGPQSRAGFNVTYRWQDGFRYNGDFASGLVPAVHIVDAQVSFRFPQIKSIIKLGANNLLNQYYVNAIGNAQVGGLYYVSIGYNIF